ncbi:uncharacterized protein LOC106176098 [Lingula anatina]|uniref:Uncharacterized protein LOC106176098 n=1 Tax=Lingula anatina TaxID=7574 RepID=A0A1S3JTT4_LINAN|nr:uncharacterized protein LOC106176098 [Lingula anatina]|eukprot:XP_013413780.1 uncharacterized protein LOC106176098 [Lingula anatina]
MGLGHTSGFTVEIENETPHELHLRDSHTIDRRTGVSPTVTASILPGTVVQQAIESHGCQDASYGAHVRNIQYAVQQYQSNAAENRSLQMENESTSTAVQSASHDGHPGWVFRLQLCAAYYKKNAFYVVEIIDPNGQIRAREVFREDNALKYRRQTDENCNVNPIAASGDCPFAVDMTVSENPRRNLGWWSVRLCVRERLMCIANPASFVERLHFTFGVWKACRTATIRKLRDISDDLHLHNQSISVATITGHSTSIFAAVLGAAGFAASFFTSGASLILLAVSAAFGAGGGITVSGSTIARSVLSASAQAEANEVLQKDHNALRDILILFETIKHIGRQDLMKIKQQFKMHNVPRKGIILSTMHHAGKIGFLVGSNLLYKPIITAQKLAGELTAVSTRSITKTGRSVATSGGEDLLDLFLRAIGIQVPRNV